MRKITPAVLGVAFMFLFAGCELLALFMTGTTQDIVYDGTSRCLAVDSTATTVNLSGIAGKTLTYVAINTLSGSTTYSRNMAVTAVGSQRDALSEEENYFSQIEAEGANVTPLGPNGFYRVDYVPPKFEPPSVKGHSRSASRSAGEQYSVTGTASVEKVFSKGDSKAFYALTDSDLSVYTNKITCLLEGIGEDDAGNTLCYVWVDKKVLGSKNSGKTINPTMAQNLADTFAKYKAAETSLMGEESDRMVFVGYDDDDDSPTAPMTGVSETGTVVNIVVYDIGSDFKPEKTGGTLGFFSAKDYWWFDSQWFNSKGEFTQEAKKKVFGEKTSAAEYYQSSNRCKVFYCDSAWCNYNSEARSAATRWIPKDDKPSSAMISTLFHEFQHMIHYGNKDIAAIDGDYNVDSSAWFNEMMSMLVEDVLQPIIGYDESEGPSLTRLPTFNVNYYALGADTWKSGDEMVYCYSSAYAFGAWLVRNYGGAELLRELSLNEYADWESITYAVRKVTGDNVSRASLVRDWALAGCFKPTFAKENGLPTYYETPASYTAGGYTYSFSPINLFSEDYEWENEVTDSTTKKRTIETRYGPKLITSNRYTLYSSGFAHMYIGEAGSTTNSVTFSLSYSKDAKDQIYILVHDSFDSTVPDPLGSTN